MTELATIAPVTKTVVVRCDVETAFRVFTAEIGTWWPTETHAVNQGRVRELVFEQRDGGEVFEISESGERCHWARVTAWEPPHRLMLDWHVDSEAQAPTEIEVRFTPQGDVTRVELEHRNWERLGESGRDRRDSYASGWDPVLERYVSVLGG
jgi:uncharacterized protein YndB with AHSA1/START domain